MKLLVAALACAGCGTVQVVPGQFVVLPSSQAGYFLRPCSRPGVPAFEATWEPDPAVVQEMETRFGALAHLRVKQCCLLGAQIRDVNGFYRQYVGVVIGARRFIYINAYAIGHGAGLTTAPRDVCDGGDAFWGVLYDVESKEFSDLAVNGVA